MTIDNFKVEGVRFVKRGDLTLIEVENAFAKALLTPFGASVLSYCPKTADGEFDKDVLWVSPQAVYDGKAAIRGGIPICWPWFGGYKEDFHSEVDVEQPPNHGFVRKTWWKTESIKQLGNGAVEIRFGLESNADTRAVWPHSFRLQLKVVIGPTLSLTLSTTNLNEYALSITEALHTYFAVADSRRIEVDGLQGAVCIDTLDNNSRSIQQGKLLPPESIDNVYLNVAGDISIKSLPDGPKLLLETVHAQSCVVWNPGSEIVKGFADIDNADWTDFICVETGNVWGDRVVIESGETHRSSLIVSREN
ncbi:D-hexose-6-phosphate mutarotase [Thiomicrorhabdus sp.]|uniref:D-hexose-6-phosphate mutarotase n=1 Tax=Thiomicrorhabdus sp. TaxID=2039724 RepID=UPI0029C68A18|nr:D-hexose-6-phosphate mutarotase [Thiomicrorhabdus sp.]